MENEVRSPPVSGVAGFFLAVLAGVLAAATGALVAKFLPQDQSGWIGIALIPFWLFLELLLGALAEIFSVPGKPNRLTIGIVVVGSFYAGALLPPLVAA